ncbi:MAG: class I SAM-dependent RNA methyltransferase [Bacteroidales bacterium]
MKKQVDHLNMVAKTMSGLEELLSQELDKIGAKNITILNRAVAFTGTFEILYRANYQCRLALRILINLATFNVKDEKDLYVGVGKINWRKYLTVEGTLAVDAITSDSVFNNSMYVGLKTKDAIVDQFRRIYDKRPSVDTKHPDLRVNVRVSGNECTISVDSSGDSLHHRGYRNYADKAPINEVLAAGLIAHSGYKGQCHFVDPMCGSGTLLVEAAMVAMNMPSGYYRKEFGFEFWKNFKSKLWDRIRNESDAEIRDFDYEIVGGDSSKKAISIAKDNIKFARLHKDIELRHTPMEDIKPPKGPGIVVTNPPYGERLEEDDLLSLYHDLGDSFKSNFIDYSAFVISSNIEALKNIGLKATQRIPVFNGPLECRIYRFDIYSGSKKGINSEEID